MKNTRKKVLIYSPYIDILGGGERHILSILQVFDQSGFTIDLAWNDKTIKDKIKDKLKLKFKNLNIIPNFIISANQFMKVLKTHQYDFFFYVTDGSYFLSRARKNYVFAMYPKESLYNMKFINRIKLFNYSIIANGEFTAKYIDRWFGRVPKIIHPYINEDFFTIGKNKHTTDETILSVGRFFEHLHSKRQDILIDAFTSLKKKNPAFKNYKLVLVGSAKEDDIYYLDKLRKKARNDKKIEFIINPTFNQLIKYYSKAQFYWHAAGYGLDESEHPDKVEHLGITPLEAMASRCITLTHNSGGPKRLITERENGLLYENVDELVSKTSLVMKDTNLQQYILKNAYDFAKSNFSYEVFKQNVKSYFSI